MGVKLYADTAAKLIRMTYPPASGRVTLDVQVDLWSDLIEDWNADVNLRKHTFPVVAIGGDTFSGKKLGTTYGLLTPWQIDPDLSQDVEVGAACTYEWDLYGGTGTNEAHAQEGQMPFDGEIPHLHLKVKRVGTPTDSLRVGIYDALGGTLLQESTVDGDSIPATVSGSGEYVGFDSDNLASLSAMDDLYIVIDRTGPRDLTNYYVLCVDDDVYGGTAYSAHTKASGSWAAQTNRDLCMTVTTLIPYELTVEGNLLHESPTLSVVLPTRGVNVVSVISTLVERVETGVSGLTPEESTDLSRMRKHLTNDRGTDEADAKWKVKDDDGSDFEEAPAWEDYDMTQPFRGQGVRRVGKSEPTP